MQNIKLKTKIKTSGGLVTWQLDEGGGMQERFILYLGREIHEMGWVKILVLQGNLAKGMYGNLYL